MTVGSNWAGSHDYGATALHRPTTVDEVRELVAGSDRIRPLGTRHSFNDLADSPGDLLSLEALDAEVHIEPAARTVSCSAGLRYGHLAGALQDNGWAIHNLASLPHISIAGAVATATHGSGDRNGTLSTAVAAIELVTADGELLRVARGHPQFDGMVVSLGALGVVTQVTLDIEPTFEIRQTVFEGLDWPTLLRNFDGITSAAYSVSVFTDWRTIGSVWLKARASEGEPPAELFGALPAPEERHPITSMPAENTTSQLGVPGPWNERLAHFKLGFTPSAGDEIQSEYLVPRHHAIAAIEAILRLGDRIGPNLLVAEIRTMAADALWLSGAFETDAVGLHFTWIKNPAAVLALLPDIEKALAPFDARPHWGKVFVAPRPYLYPMRAEFVALAERLDPTGKFRNSYLDRTIFNVR